MIKTENSTIRRSTVTFIFANSQWHTEHPSALSRGVRFMSAGSRPFPQTLPLVSHPEQSEGSRLVHGDSSASPQNDKCVSPPLPLENIFEFSQQSWRKLKQPGGTT